jgi:signal transduction histidine kinase
MSMRPAASRSGVFASLRSRVVAISVIPSLIFICAVIGVGWYQSGAALRDQRTAALVGDGIDATAAFSASVLEERRISVEGTGDLTAARSRTDAAIDGVHAFMSRLPDTVPVALRESFGRLSTAADAVSRARRDIGAGARDLDAYEAYEAVVEPLTAVVSAQVAPGAEIDVVTGMSAAGDLLAAVESIRSADLVMAADGPVGLELPAYREFTDEAGQIAETMERAVAALPADSRDAGAALLSSPEWRTFTADTELVLAAGPHVVAPPPGGPAPADNQRNNDRPAVDRTIAVVGDLTAAGDAVAGRASDIAFGTAHDAVAIAVSRAGTAINLVVGGVLGLVALAAAAMLVAMRTGNRLGRRMAGLQATTHATSARLPAVLDRIRRGEQVDVDAEFPAVEHGTDEIAEVGAAVDAAQRSAVAAAAEEARTRAGANAVFLNIAHRSQAIVHRQLQVLDEAERAEDDSDQLGRLFQLDHLSTRERRNAENLIIMGGQEPRRRWRRPVPLAEIIRSAVSESEQYTRITLGDTPFRHVDGVAVGDLIHLLAELVDNATSFSPPQCPIDISASIVGRGVAVEIEDRGLGIEQEPRERLNEMLADPPDFGLLTLSEDSRLGMFVVSRLAQRHGIRVTLLESTYGGVQALVLVPNILLVAPPAEDDEPEAEPEPVRGGAPYGRGTNGRGTNGRGTSGRDTNGRGTSGLDANGRGPNGLHSDGKAEGPGGNGHYTPPNAFQRGGPTAQPPQRPSRATDPGTPSAPADGATLPERSTPAAVGRPAEAPPADPAPIAAPTPSFELPSVVSETETLPTAAAPDLAAAPQMPAVSSAASTTPVADAAAPAAAPVTAQIEDVRPPLPERRPQGHLAKGLRGRPETGPAAAGVAEPAEPAAGRSSSAMSAMQRGVRSSRKDTEEGSAT